MPKYYEEEDSKPKVACSGLRIDLKTCLVESDCVQLVSKLYNYYITVYKILIYFIICIIV